MLADQTPQEELFDMLLGMEDRPAAQSEVVAPVSSASTPSADPLEDLFDALVESDQPRESSAPPPPPAHTNALSSLQERLWLVQQLEPTSTAYIIPCHLRFRGPLQPAALTAAIGLLWQRHESLRTVFPVVDGQPRRALLPLDAFKVAEYDFSTASSKDAWRQHYLAEQSGPMALETGPLFRVCLYKIAPEEHVLLLDLHHINGDGVSVEILREEIFAAYVAIRDGRPVSLPSPGRTYADFVAAENARRATPTHRQELETRIQSLTGAPTRIDFQFDRPLPAHFGHVGGIVTQEPADVALYHRAGDSGQSAGLSPFMVYLAAFGSLLHLHTKQEDLLVGVPLSLRMNGGFDRTVGFLVNTGVTRLDFSGRPTLREVMRRTAKSVREMLSCPDAPLEHLARALRDRRVLDRPPLIQATISYMQANASLGEAIDGLTIDPFYVLRRSAMFELTLDLMLYGQEGLCGIEYSSDAWEESTARRMLDHFHLILRAIVDRPEAHLDEIDLLPETHRQSLATALEGETLAAPAAVVPDLLRELARLHPEQIALLAGETETSHARLQELVALRRGQLGVLGLRSGAVLALSCAPGLEWTVTALAALAEGIVVLPVDTQLPGARLRYLLENSRAALLWHDDTSAPASDEAGWPCPLACGASAPSATPITGPARARLQDTAYLLYTSGTTGQPKGVRVSHAAFATHAISAGQAYGLSANDCALVFAPMHFDAAWEQLFAPLLAGGSVLIRDAHLWAPDELCRRLTRHRVTCADLPPQYLRELLYHLEHSPACLPESLRLMLSGGEAMPTALAQAWLAGPLRHVPLINAYGPTESVVTALYNRLGLESRVVTAGGVVPIGHPLPGRVLRILDPQGREVGAGIAGELCIGGAALADGYHGDTERTAEAFRYWRRTSAGGHWTEATTPGAIRLYRTGDRVRLGPDNCIEFLGRIDRQIKIRGFRIEPGEIEAVLARHPAIAQAFVTAIENPVVGAQLVAYCVAKEKTPPSSDTLVTWLGQWLPDYMVPSALVFLPAFPTTASGKINAAALPKPELRREAAPAPTAAPTDEIEAKVAAIWADVLGRTDVGLNDNFFDLGGHSLLLVRVHSRLLSELGASISLLDLFAHPTVARVAQRLRGATSATVKRGRRVRQGDVAVIGMAGRFPGAENVTELWANLVAGKESIRFFTDAELTAAGVPAELRTKPDYVPAHGHMDGTELFDAGFFGYTPKEAEVIDPQQRVFLEEAWHALEHAGYDPDRFQGDIGVFGGVGMSLYLLNNLGTRLQQGQGAEAYAISMATDKDFITTRVSYKLNLRGPSVNINTACSTSLVAIHMAAEAVQRGECDLALAGGVTLHVPPISGYVFQPGGIASPDGHCRAFAEDALGTVGGSGVALVVLKRLEQAIADGDTIHAVIKGSAINNDGADKVGFTAPGVHRQRDVIRAALDNAGCSARSIQYLEAHGTGTPMGDPIEVQALSEAFAEDRPAAQSCFIGSIKSNIGHLDTAAGVAGFIKTVLALEHGVIPPTLHCTQPSTKIGFERTSFRVVQTLTPWPTADRRRAGVSSFGMGGTNAHVVLEAPPARAAAATTREDVWCLPLSARSPKSLLTFAQNLAQHLEANPQLDATDVWFTLSEGRRRFAVRAVVMAGSRHEAVAALRALGEADLLRTDRDGKVISGHGLSLSAQVQARGEFAAARAFATAWLTGALADASALLPTGAHRRLPLPLYVFDHEVFWVEETAPAASAPTPQSDAPTKLPLADWFYFPSWERLPARRTETSTEAALLLVHGNSAVETRWLAALRAAGQKFVACRTGEKLGAELAQFAGSTTQPVCCWHLAALAHEAGSPADYAARLDALLADIRALATALPQRSVQILLPAPHRGGPDTPADPAFAYLDAVSAVIPHEYGAIAPRVLRIDPAASDAVVARAVRTASTLTGNDRVLAFSGAALWRQTFVRLTADQPDNGAARLRDRGVYLITGGLGGVGLTLASHLARACKARLVLVSRHEPDAAQREVIRALLADGAQVRTAALDIAEVSALRTLVGEVCAQWGRIDGVIHTAGVAGGSLVARTKRDDIDRVLRAKVAGTVALADALQGREPDFVVLCSSLTAALGGPGQVAYAAANAWLDAFAAEQSVRQPGLWTSVQWDSWAEVGMAARAIVGGKPGSAERKLLREWTVSPAAFWPWGEHRIGGAAVLPGSAYLELLAQAAGMAGPLELTAVALSEPMVHDGEASRKVQVWREGDDLILQSDDGKQVREHARARVASAPVAAGMTPLAEISARCAPYTLADSEENASGIVIDAGSRWRIAGEYRKGKDEALAWLALPSELAGDLTTHPLHPGLLDIALSYYIDFVAGGTGVLPWRYEKVRVFAPLTARIASHIRLRSHSERALVLDVDLRDDTGRLLMQVEGYTLVRAEASATTATAPGSAPRRENSLPSNPFALTPAEGVEVFLRTLAAGEPTVCISTVAWRHAERPTPLAESLTAPAAEPSAAESKRKPRPETATPFRAASTAAEKLMGEVWGEVLGYDGLGIDDDLFDLGADSLTALQASARLKELIGRELSMERFFARATIAHLAEDLPVQTLAASSAPAAQSETWEEGEL